MPEEKRSISAARNVVLGRFAWVDGHADVWAAFRDGRALRLLVHALVEPFVDDGITAVCGIESRGFLLGGAAAIQLGVGFIAIRKNDGLLPGVKSARISAPDYVGKTHRLRLQRSALTPGDRLILVDDWIETGSQFRAARELVNDCGASLIAYSVMVDDLTDQQRADLGRGHALLRANELPTTQS